MKKSPVKSVKMCSDAIGRKVPVGAAAACCCVGAITLGLRPKQSDAVHEKGGLCEGREDQERGRRITHGRREGFACAKMEV